MELLLLLQRNLTISLTMAYREISEAEFSDLSGRIIYEDNHLLIVNKKVGEITQGDKTGDECLAETYKAFLARRDAKAGNVFLGIPHRLDRPVSGIVIFAKTSKALERMSAMFRDSEVHKTYWALCCARPEEDEGLLEDWMIRNEQQNKSYVVSHKAGKAKLARLKYRYLLRTERYHLIEVELLTGRHHQIRCQLSHIGCPIKGDLKYGAPRSNPDGGICLQSHSVSFIHPVRKEEIRLSIPAPSDWKGINCPSGSIC